MPVEFALRPRIRLREDSPPPRKPRLRLPRFALPVAAYWLAVAGITYAFLHRHDSAGPPPAVDETALAADPASTREARPWWRRVPEATPAAPPLEVVPPSPVPPEQAPEPALLPTTTPSLSPPEERPAEASLSTTPKPDRVPDTRPRPPASHDLPTVPDPADDVPAPVPTPSPPRSESRGRGSLPSCEAAIAAANQDMDFSQGNGTADLPTETIAAVLENGAWLSSCNVPASTSLEVCVAIRDGNVIGASVAARPANADVTNCVRNRAAALQFPYSSHVDIARTRF